MVKSMTGFGRSENQYGDVTHKVEIRSVNNRYIEIKTRLPKALSNLELPLKKLIKSKCGRGSFDVTVILETANEESVNGVVQPNMALAAQYFGAFNKIKDQLGLAGEIDINSLLSLRDLVKVEPETLDPENENQILEVIEKAVDALIQMRIEEGEALGQDILNRLQTIERHAEFIVSRQPEMIKAYKDRLVERINQLTDGLELDEARLAQEAAIMADRCDITEEVIRLESHLKQFKIHLEKSEPVGRKLEFITQEINRETNTIGSKTIDSQVAQTVIEIKSDLEKIREQLQNIE